MNKLDREKLYKFIIGFIAKLEEEESLVDGSDFFLSENYKRELFDDYFNKWGKDNSIK